MARSASSPAAITRTGRSSSFWSAKRSTPRRWGRRRSKSCLSKFSTRQWGRGTSLWGPVDGWPNTSWPLIVARSRGVSPKPSGAGHPLNEDDLLVQAGVPDELRLVWDRQDDEQLLAVCRLLVAGHCLYGVDKNPLAVDLAKASLWLITAASGLPLTFLDHRLRCGDSLLGIPAEEVVRPWIEPQPAKGKSKARKTRTIKPVELLISPAAPQETFDYYAPNRDALCRAFRRAFVYLQALENAVEAEPTNFSLHRSKYEALRGLLEPWNHLHQLRVGLAFADDASGGVDLINTWLERPPEITDRDRGASREGRVEPSSRGAFGCVLLGA